MSNEPLLDPVDGAEHQMFHGIQIDMVRAGDARLRRVVYRPGTRWSTSLGPLVGTDLCMHAHVGFLAQGHLHFEFPDGCTMEFEAPQFVVVPPGHDATVPSEVPAVLIEFDFEKETSARLNLPTEHTHG